MNAYVKVTAPGVTASLTVAITVERSKVDAHLWSCVLTWLTTNQVPRSEGMLS